MPFPSNNFDLTPDIENLFRPFFFETQNDVTVLRNETALFLSPPPELKPNRQRLGCQVGLAALAAVGRFGGGSALGSYDSCEVRGFFGSCQDQSKANAANIVVSRIFNTS